MSDTFSFHLTDLAGEIGVTPYPASFVVQPDCALAFAARHAEKCLLVVAPLDNPILAQFQGETRPFREAYLLKLCPTTHANALALRSILPWLQPRLLGLTTSAGFGDRLGLATPGHIRALRKVLSESAASEILPMFAQQSIREMARTHRTPESVLDDATWGTFQAGWRGGIAADADHLKTPADIDACVAAGYSFYTIDPGAYVENLIDTLEVQQVARLVADLPWDILESCPEELKRHYFEQDIDLGSRTLHMEAGDIFYAAAKYGRAIAHVVTMFRHLESTGAPFELEISVDETETPTSHTEHIYIASELKRLGVRWVSLAPRYVGRFEKGVEYIGDLAALQTDLQGHAEIARALGPYKLSLHSGSDKFSVYPLIQAVTNGQVHLKTAGTSFLEALRVCARVDPALFREIAAFARVRYPEDRAYYHVSANLQRTPDLKNVFDAELASLLDDFDMRQVLHVTFGSILDRFGKELRAMLVTHEQAYEEQLEQHFYHHLKPFTK